MSDDVLFHGVRESDIAGDSDSDGMYDDFDGCVDTSNPDALDLDGDGLGD